MTTDKVRHATVNALLAIRGLGLAIAQARSDGPAVMQAFREGQLRVIIDESVGALTIGIVGDDGPARWLETIACDIADERTFGALASLMAEPTVTH